MRNAQTERLVGGYATNTLTEAERQALFEAALEDQELFNALQDEQALRDLLDDADSRAMIERAAKTPRPEPVRRFTLAWAWGLAACAAVLAAVVFILGPTGQQVRPAASARLSELRAPPAQELTDKLKHALRYSVMRRGPNGSFAAMPENGTIQTGDAVRLAVRASASGFLTVSEQSEGGDWKTLQVLPVRAGNEYTAPASAIEITAPTRLRLLLAPGEGAGVNEPATEIMLVPGKPVAR